jgi:exopolyphosphatase/guanosine-5'-triphosphate,3'-diphosphate pyrophosphatase
METNMHCIGAIDVGGNAARLVVARVRTDGRLDWLVDERDAIRPGERAIGCGGMPRSVADRLVATSTRFAATCRRFDAVVRAVATSPLRAADNRAEVLRRVRVGAGLELEVISAEEEGRLTCLGALHGRGDGELGAVIDLGGGSVEVAVARGERAAQVWTAPLGARRVSERFGAVEALTRVQLTSLRACASAIASACLPDLLPGGPRAAVAASGTLRATIRFAADDGADSATAEQIGAAVDVLASLDLAARRARVDPGRAEIIVAGAVGLEAIMRRVGLTTITATDRGLRHGILVELERACRRRAVSA